MCYLSIFGLLCVQVKFALVGNYSELAAHAGIFSVISFTFSSSCVVISIAVHVLDFLESIVFTLVLRCLLRQGVSFTSVDGYV